jgi:6-phosphogluconolactonase
MTVFSKLVAGIALLTVIGLASAAYAGTTYVYISNAEDGNIGMYTLATDGTLTPGPRVEAGKLVMPMSVSPNKRYLYAALRTKPYQVATFAIDPKTGGLTLLSKAPMAETSPYIRTDRTGRYLFAAGYGGALVSVNGIGKDGKATEPIQVIPTARNPHSIVTDNTNHYVFVPHLGSDEVFQFRFNAKTGKLTANTPPLVLMKASTGPRHIIISPDNKFAYLLSELVGTVTTLSLDDKTGLLTTVSEVSILPPGSKLKPGLPRLPAGQGDEPRDVTNDIWASDLHLTPDGKFLYAAERTNNTMSAFSVDTATGKLTYLSSITTEKQPRGFAIDPTGKYMIVTGELSNTISVYSIGANGVLTLLKKYPTGKDSNWVEIVSFD